MKKIILIVCLLSVFIGNSQTLNYDITSKEGKSIGHLTAAKTVNDSIMQIDIVSDVTAHIFIKIAVKYKLHCTYKNGELLFSSNTTYVNGEVHGSTKIEKTDDHYTITKNGHITKFYNKINFSSGLLYFEAPENQAVVFAESTGLEKPVKKTGANAYNITNPSNHDISQYTYSNGVLQKATIRNTYMTFILTKKQ